MPADDQLAAYLALRRARGLAVHELANAWNIVTANLPGLRAHLHDPEALQILDDALEADRRARVQLEALVKLLG